MSLTGTGALGSAGYGPRTWAHGGGPGPGAGPARIGGRR